MFWKVAGAALLVLGLVSGPSDALTRMKAGHVLPATSDQGLAAEFFAKRVNELSNGEIEIKVFHAGELAKSMPAQLENLVSGAQDLFIDTIDYFKAWDPRFGVVNTPFVFRDREHFKKFLASDLFADMISSLEKRGVVFLGKGKYNWLRAGDRGLLTRTPIMKPEDLKGYKLRMFQAEAPIKAWAAFGANIQVIPWADTYTALATGTVDGLTTVLSASYLNKQTETARFFTTVGEYYQIVAPVISKRTWDKLTPQQREIFETAANEAGVKYLEVSAAERDESDRKAQNDHGVTIIIPPMKPWLDVAKTVFERFENENILPKGLIGQVQAIK
jgi:TRAP-type C4-dicarboxylate transport system substrate-binding protein